MHSLENRFYRMVAIVDGNVQLLDYIFCNLDNQCKTLDNLK